MDEDKINRIRTARDVLSQAKDETGKLVSEKQLLQMVHDFCVSIGGMDEDTFFLCWHAVIILDQGEPSESGY